ncbi:hypothetical protein KKF81_06165 [Candidatus Micrarchaeota archaeon]|nr:hypothetical protein [Candidatus Micrarchaeota archaeon]MBU1166514.1 hypothetical protein [Candidatus Micrarchaeota archaeon]MBU1887526.1 hypothetical protein [Candidatus Micrarchaeota archaeon]
MGSCSRCGQQCHTEYGSDGRSYCSSCVFYGMNKPCWKCGMYVPASELQQYRGQWACPYCIQDMRDENRRAQTSVKKTTSVRYVPEICDRCGKNLEGRVYLWNGRKLCKSCLDEEQDSWGVVGGKPSHSVQRISVTPQKRKGILSGIERLFSEFLALFGIKTKQSVSEIVVYHTPESLKHAKPMSEGKLSEKSEEEPPPQIEGLMTKGKSRGENIQRKTSSFPNQNSVEKIKKSKKQEPEKKEDNNPFVSYKDKKKKRK